MAIPVHLQQFKAAGVYRVVFDKSTMLNNEPETLRLVVGYSEVGPFNCPVYIKDPQEFVQYFGNISKKLEKRGIFFHRMCLQMLSISPIICLNLKKFSGETVGASTISTEFNPNYDPIDDVKINIEDIFDKTRFWEISAEQLNDLNSVEGITLNNYINLSVTDTYSNSVSYFIRKASGNIISQYNVTVNDWYADRADEKPEYLEEFGNLLSSDFFAEIYVFKGKFKSSQVLASDSLKKYFVATDEIEENDEGTITNYKLKLRNDLRNPYNELIDTLDALYADPASNAIGHWVGCLIPYFRDKRGNYQALDIVFNQDNDIHKMMMSFNIDLLEEYNAVPIDLSGKLAIPVSSDGALGGGDDAYELINGVINPMFKNPLSLEAIFQGDARTNLLGNMYAPVIADKIEFASSIDNKLRDIEFPELSSNKTYITGSLYVSDVKICESEDDSTESNGMNADIDVARNQQYKVILKQIRPTSDGETENTVTIKCSSDRLDYVLEHVGVTDYKLEVEDINSDKLDPRYILYHAYTKDGEEWKLNENLDDANLLAGGTWWHEGFDAYEINDAFPEHAYYGPGRIVTSIRRIENREKKNDQLIEYTDIDTNFVCSFTSINILSKVVPTIPGTTLKDSVYGSSISFINTSKWEYSEDIVVNGGIYNGLISKTVYDNSLQLVLKKGDCLLAADGAVDNNHDKIINDDDKDRYYDNVYVQDMGTEYDNDNNFLYHYILLSGCPLGFEEFGTGWSYDSENDYTNTTEEGWAWNDSSYAEAENDELFVVRVDAPLNQEIGDMLPHYLEGYTYKNARPNGTDMWAKLQWQKSILSALTDYSGLRKGLLNKANIDYRYVVDTFESFPQSELKAELSLLCKEKESAFCIANLPAIRTFVKCPYISFTDEKNIFNSKYIVDGRNRKKPANDVFSLPSETNGASFSAFYTPLKFTDGYVDSIIPSAGLVSNLFIQKYMSRQPYYIVAGPNYGHIDANGLVGPDYKFTREELYDLEPFGFNCMVYRPSFGTFINANQTAKQTPLSALSRVNVRELVIYLQDEVEKVLQSYQWEFNNQTTRNAILDKANQICALIKANGGIQTYLNIMDESNNTPEIIDNEMAVLSTHIEPGFGCGKMVHELTLYRTGQMKSYVGEVNG